MGRIMQLLLHIIVNEKSFRFFETVNTGMEGMLS